jgi:hypothetical protein
MMNVCIPRIKYVPLLSGVFLSKILNMKSSGRKLHALISNPTIIKSDANLNGKINFSSTAYKIVPNIPQNTRYPSSLCCTPPAIYPSLWFFIVEMLALGGVKKINAPFDNKQIKIFMINPRFHCLKSSLYPILYPIIRIGRCIASNPRAEKILYRTQLNIPKNTLKMSGVFGSFHNVKLNMNPKMIDTTRIRSHSGLVRRACLRYPWIRLLSVCFTTIFAFGIDTCRYDSNIL